MTLVLVKLMLQKFKVKPRQLDPLRRIMTRRDATHNYTSRGEGGGGVAGTLHTRPPSTMAQRIPEKKNQNSIYFFLTFPKSQSYLSIWIDITLIHYGPEKSLGTS